MNKVCEPCKGKGFLHMLKGSGRGNYDTRNGDRDIQRCDDCMKFKTDKEALKAHHIECAPDVCEFSNPRERKFYRALVSIAQTLGISGGCSANKCQGCDYEMADAAYTARTALGGEWEKRLKVKHKQKRGK